MQFDSIAAAWAMGGHGPFVWSAYAITAFTLIALIVAPLQRQRRFFHEQRGIERRRQAQSQRTGAADPATDTPIKNKVH
ncbi:MAG: heme exporter protein CcmD [Verrucomicrobiaceae bacterium]|nr:heme exporter protein CcmD [Verrucomicrobiaceae bacterium]